MRFKFVSLLIFFSCLGLFQGQVPVDEEESDDVFEQTLDDYTYQRQMDSLLGSMKETDDVIFPKIFQKIIKISISPKNLTIPLPNPKNLFGIKYKELLENF